MKFSMIMFLFAAVYLMDATNATTTVVATVATGEVSEAVAAGDTEPKGAGKDEDGKKEGEKEGGKEEEKGEGEEGKEGEEACSEAFDISLFIARMMVLSMSLLKIGECIDSKIEGVAWAWKSHFYEGLVALFVGVCGEIAENTVEMVNELQGGENAILGDVLTAIGCISYMVMLFAIGAVFLRAIDRKHLYLESRHALQAVWRGLLLLTILAGVIMVVVWVNTDLEQHHYGIGFFESEMDIFMLLAVTLNFALLLSIKELRDEHKWFLTMVFLMVLVLITILVLAFGNTHGSVHAKSMMAVITTLKVLQLEPMISCFLTGALLDKESHEARIKAGTEDDKELKALNPPSGEGEGTEAGTEDAAAVEV